MSDGITQMIRFLISYQQVNDQEQMFNYINEHINIYNVMDIIWFLFVKKEISLICRLNVSSEIFKTHLCIPCHPELFCNIIQSNGKVKQCDLDFLHNLLELLPNIQLNNTYYPYKNTLLLVCKSEQNNFRLWIIGLSHKDALTNEQIIQSLMT